jgi:ribosomal-protein-alanine N-acetyltransferase
VEPRIRDFQVEDFETLWRIDQQCFAPGISYSRPELAAYIRMPGSFTLVAEQQRGQLDGSVGQGIDCGPAGVIVGFVVASANRRGAGHIITIDVLPAARRSGLGSRLLAAAESRLRAGSCTTVRLETAVDNASALAFYKRHHYNLVRTIPRYYPGGIDALVLRKDLLSPALTDKLHP